MKSGYIAIIGKPNIGKSTLLNALLKTKLSIVSEKPQTTRRRVLGILTEADCQCYFLDTPGLMKPEYELQRMMIEQIQSACLDADIVLCLVDPWFRPPDLPSDLLASCGKKPVLCAINKIDLVPKAQLLPVIEKLKNKVDEILLVSALTGDGIEELKKTIFRYLPEGPFLYPVEDISDSPERFFVAELIRERVFELFKQEIPYATCVVIDEYKERDKGKDFIRAIIYVERESQRRILIGNKAEALKNVGAQARKEIEAFLGRDVYLELWVKVRAKWRRDKKFLKELGY